jgi:hypothetical protein
MPTNSWRARQENGRYTDFGRESTAEPAGNAPGEGHCVLAQRSTFNVVAGYIDGIKGSQDDGGIARSVRRVGDAR